MTAAETRGAASSLARRAGRIAESAGDIETAQQMRDLAREIDRMRITRDLGGFPEETRT